MDGFLEVVKRLTTAKVVGELWLDGSYLTSKVDPEDIDVVLRLNSAFYDACTPEQKAAVDWIQGDLHYSHHCHSFVLIQWPDGHPLFWYGEYGYAYWMRQWGFSQSDVTKGMAVVQLPRSDI